MNDPYIVLGVSRSATDKEIKKAYRELSRKYHPDNFTDEDKKAEAEDKFRQIQEAYNAIVDERSGKSSGYNYGGYNNAGGYGGQAGEYSQEDQYLLSAMQYIRARRYNEAINVLNSISERSARWYYYSSYANMGLGNNVIALDYAKKAVELDPTNQDYTVYYENLKAGRTTPFNAGTTGGFGGFGGFGGGPFGGGYGGGPGGYGGYGNYGETGGCGTGSMCCDLLCADACCECMGGDLCSCI